MTQPNCQHHYTVRSALPEDLDNIYNFISHYTADGTLLPRNRDNIKAQVKDFVVAMDNTGLFLGCGALQTMNDKLVEVRSIAVEPSYRGLGIGTALLVKLLDEARQRKFTRAMCLTRRSSFFMRCGFVIAAKEHFPEKVWNDCRLCPRQQCCDEVAMEKQL